MRWRVLVALAVVLTAGCGSLFAASDDTGTAATDTLTPAPVPAETPTPERWDLAPGLTSTGVVDLEALVAAHRAATANRSYVWREFRGTSAHVNGSIPIQDRTVAEVESRSRYHLRSGDQRVRLRSGLTNVANYSEYADGTVRTIRFRFVGRTSYERRHTHPTDPNDHRLVGASATSAIRQYLALSNVTVSAVRLDDRPYYLVVGRNWPAFTGETVHNGTITAIVSPDGFVRSLEAVYTVRSVGQPRRVRYGFTYEQVDNTTVEPPDWYRDGS